MWVTKQLDRARRRFRAADVPKAADDESVADLELSVVRADLERLVEALAASGERGSARPDSPARLEAALTAVIDRVGGCGRPEITRSPAGLYTPEYWHIHVEGADGRTREAMGRLCAGERIG